MPSIINVELGNQVGRPQLQLSERAMQWLLHQISGGNSLPSLPRESVSPDPAERINTVCCVQLTVLKDSGTNGILLSNQIQYVGKT